MSKFTDNIRKIAKTDETNAKIKPPITVDKPSIPSQRGIGNAVLPQVCPLFYSTRDNGYDVGDLLSGNAGPLLNNKCDHLDRITGLTDFDTAQNTDNYGGVVTLVVHFDGNFEDYHG